MRAPALTRLPARPLELLGVKVVVASPYPLDGGSGNAVTALRLAGLLDSARVSHGWDEEPADVMVALHAHRSRDEILRFQRHCPGGRVVVLVTGTDLHEFPREEFLEIGSAVDGLVVMHEMAFQALPAVLQEKTRVIYPSVDLPALKLRPEPNLVTLIGHLRPVKNPFLAISDLPDLDIRLVHIGEALAPDMEREARRWMEQEARYTWLGGLPRAEALDWLTRSRVTLNTSHSEGGSNVVAEAITLGVPILASRIDGNVGLLGDQYEGLFTEGELPTLLNKAFQEESWRRSLGDYLGRRKALFHAETERRCWTDWLEQIFFSGK